MKLCNDVLTQRDSRIPNDMQIAEYVRSIDCTIDDLDEAILMVVARQGEIYELDSIASIMFEELLLGGPVDDPVAHLGTIFDNPERELREFYRAFKTDMTNYGLVERTGM
ncbi:hypothetical protein [Trueperella sp.]|uniref:hypothetical protein n=1 Tax=Trueperella sp. TaxID=2699835 RepID=UPI00260EE97E|nr:hypothetical protein [Trueperella sp.]